MGAYLEVDESAETIKSYWLPGTAGQRAMTHILVVGDNHIVDTRKYSKIMPYLNKGTEK